MNKINIQKIKSIQLSLLKRETYTKENKAEFSKKITAKFIIPKNFFEVQHEEFMLKELVSRMYSDLASNAPDEADSLGIWVEYGNLTIENSISLHTLDLIRENSNNTVNPIYEFLKMSFNNEQLDISISAS
jgi:hypothetical protein